MLGAWGYDLYIYYIFCHLIFIKIFIPPIIIINLSYYRIIEIGVKNIYIDVREGRERIDNCNKTNQRYTHHRQTDKPTNILHLYIIEYISPNSH